MNERQEVRRTLRPSRTGGPTSGWCQALTTASRRCTRTQMYRVPAVQGCQASSALRSFGGDPAPGARQPFELSERRRRRGLTSSPFYFSTPLRLLLLLLGWCLLFLQRCVMFLLVCSGDLVVILLLGGSRYTVVLSLPSIQAPCARLPKC